MAGVLVPPVRNLLYYPGTTFRAAVSEDLIQRMSGLANFISLYQHSEKQFFINGPYSIVAGVQNAIDGLAVFEFNAQIIDVWMFNITPGSAGTTELDAKIGTIGGSFTSIFSTTPKITSAAAANTWVGAPGGSYSPPAGTTAPVIATTGVIAAHTAIRCDILQKQTGGENCGLLIHYIPVT